MYVYIWIQTYTIYSWSWEATVYSGGMVWTSPPSRAHTNTDMYTLTKARECALERHKREREREWYYPHRMRRLVTLEECARERARIANEKDPKSPNIWPSSNGIIRLFMSHLKSLQLCRWQQQRWQQQQQPLPSERQAFWCHPQLELPKWVPGFLATYWVPGATRHSILRPENPILTKSQSSLGVLRPRAFTFFLEKKCCLLESKWKIKYNLLRNEVL